MLHHRNSTALWCRNGMMLQYPDFIPLRHYHVVVLRGCDAAMVHRYSFMTLYCYDIPKLSMRNVVTLWRFDAMMLWRYRARCRRGQASAGRSFQPTTQPTIPDVLHDFRVFRQSPRCCKSLVNLSGRV
jgi:hypothetical protein